MIWIYGEFIMYSVVTYAGNSVLNYNLDYNSLLYLGYCEPARAFVLFVVHCNTKSLVHQGRSRWFVLADARADLAGPVLLQAKFRIYTSALLNEINNKEPCLFDY